MPKPEFPMTISAGNMIAIGALLVGLGVNYQQIRSGLDAESKTRVTAVEGIESRLDTLTQKDGAFETRLRYIEEQSARTDERYSLILTMMSELKTQVTSLSDRKRLD